MMRPIYIVMVGPDGSGKTTVAELLATELANRGVVHRRDFYFGILPQISRFFGRRPATEDVRKSGVMSGMSKPLSPWRAALVGIWYGVDHLLGNFVIWRARSRNEIFVFARSYHDFTYQLAYINIPKWIPRFFIACGPQPALIVCQYLEPLAVYSRKPELTVEEIDAQYSRIFGGLGRRPQFRCLDGSGGIEGTVRRIISEIAG